MDNRRERQDKIVKMKVQTAKILWQEDQRQAAFLVLESVDDPRADELRQQLGFDEHYEARGRPQQGISWTLFGVVTVIVMAASFALGTLLDLRRDATTTEPPSTADTVLATPIPATLPVLEPQIEMTGTASQIQLTQSALENQQGSSMSLLDATETARYEQATGTADAGETAAGG